MLTLPDGRCVTLKKLFLDRRLPQPVRDRVPVLELDGQVIAVAASARIRAGQPVTESRL